MYSKIVSFLLLFSLVLDADKRGVLALQLPRTYVMKNRNMIERASPHRQQLFAVPDWLRTEEGAPEDAEQIAQQQTVTVRFINTPGGRDVVQKNVPQGSNLMAIGDLAGIELPRACRTGLCGTCTVDLIDPAAIKTSTNPRDGRATIRACSSRCGVPEGMEEMVIDLERLKERKTSSSSKNNKGGIDYESEKIMNPMQRFAGDWEREFKPLWEQANAYPGGSRSKKLAICKKCSGKGRVICYACSGRGKVLMAGRPISGGDQKMMQCPTCVGLQTIGCGYCNASGLLTRARNKKL